MTFQKVFKRVLFAISGLGIGSYLFLWLLTSTGGGNTYDDMRMDSAIVFGARAYKDGRYNPCLVARVEKAVALYKNNNVTKLILTGGYDSEDGVNEAETMQKIALEKGVKKEAILLENKATSSYENVVYSKALMEKEGIRSAFLVSEPFHTTRIELIARSLGMSTVPSAAVDSPCWTKWTYFSRYSLKEPLAVMYYLLTGKITPQAFLMFDRK